MLFCICTQNYNKKIYLQIFSAIFVVFFSIFLSYAEKYRRKALFSAASITARCPGPLSSIPQRCNTPCTITRWSSSSKSTCC